VTLDSNGYLLPQKIKLISSLDHLILALDGPEEAHDLNREPGAFQKVMAAIEAVSGKIPLWTITVLTKNNINSIDFILDAARKYRFLATFQLLHHNDRMARNHDILLPSPASYKKAIEKLIIEKKKGAPIASSLNYLYHILHWPDYRTATYPYEINNLKCWAGRLYCNVDTDGSVYPCSLLVDRMGSLNFLEVGFEKAFENLKQNSCKGCMASCFTEYNHLYSLDISTITEWLKAMKKTRAYLCKKTRQ
jgi:MoaA/NifB/PqqE/SkfB family radical SAM enzyme